MKPSPALHAFLARLFNYVFSVAVYQATWRAVDYVNSPSPASYFSLSSPDSGWELAVAFLVGLLVTLAITGLVHVLLFRKSGCSGCRKSQSQSLSSNGQRRRDTSSRLPRSRSCSPPRPRGAFKAQPARSGSPSPVRDCLRCLSRRSQSFAGSHRVSGRVLPHFPIEVSSLFNPFYFHRAAHNVLTSGYCRILLMCDGLADRPVPLGRPHRLGPPAISCWFKSTNNGADTYPKAVGQRLLRALLLPARLFRDLLDRPGSLRRAVHWVLMSPCQ